MTPIIVLPIVMGDWWGFVNALSMLLSILVRKVIMDQNRHAISTAASASTLQCCEGTWLGSIRVPYYFFGHDHTLQPDH